MEREMKNKVQKSEVRKIGGTIGNPLVRSHHKVITPAICINLPFLDSSTSYIQLVIVRVMTTMELTTLFNMVTFKSSLDQPNTQYTALL